MIFENERSARVSFPLGGIGTGCIGLAGNGELMDWEIFNRPNKNSRNGYSHFAIRAVSGEKRVAKVLQGDTHRDLSGDFNGKGTGFGFGVASDTLAGFPHFHNVVFESEFPLAKLTFSDGDFPGQVRLTAFNPMIPHESDESGIPAAFFEWEIINDTPNKTEYCLAFTVKNPCESTVNRVIRRENARGLFFTDGVKTPDMTDYRDLCVLTDAKDVDVQQYWYRGKWMDGATMFWNQFSSCDRLPERTYPDAKRRDHGTVASHVLLAPSERAALRFVLAWNAPTAYNYWDPVKDEKGGDLTWKNRYAVRFEDSADSAYYALSRFDSLLDGSRRFAWALNGSSLPPAVLDAVSSNLSVLKSPTVLRLEDGSLWGWEGCAESEGICEGSCQHVWNYAYALPFLFPDLERSLRENTLKYALTPSGASRFRVRLPLGRENGEFRPCADGQMGEVIKCYREWKISGDTSWLLSRAPDILRMLDYAFSPENPDAWDADRDGVMEGRQHHTLDMELFGPNSWLEGFYLLALECGALIADAAGLTGKAAEYRGLLENGKRWTAQNLFNGEYFSQTVDLKDKGILDRFGATEPYWNEEAGQIKYQVAGGCIIDQVLADWHAGLVGLDGVFDPGQRKTALKNLFKNNFKTSMRDVANMWRNYAVDDEAGTLICTYPDSASKPAIPIPYCEEVMTGFEYAFAGSLIQNGMISEGEAVVKAVRDRYDGAKRNPFNEIECGSNYARSMASFAMLPICSGFSFDMTQGRMGFDPVTGSGRFLWSVADTWGTVTVESGSCLLEIEGTPLTLSAFSCPPVKRPSALKIDGKPVSFTADGGLLSFDTAEIRKTLEITGR